MSHIAQQHFKVLPPDAVQLPDLDATPSQVARAWPQNEPIIALIANGANEKWSRWSVIAPATGERITLDGKDALQELRRRLDERSCESLLPNWIGYLGYELGHVIEQRTAALPQSDWPLVDLLWCDRALIHDGLSHEWWSIGGLEPPTPCANMQLTVSCSPLVDPDGSDAFIAAVERTVKYIHDGDIFQANITRRFHANIEGNVRDAALASLGDPGGWFGAWLEFPNEGRYALSLSPELFLHVDGNTQEVVTRPMKGTRPDNDDPITLLQSTKDAAELHMIVDLMRNDLGRVCTFGSMDVLEARLIEHHPTVWQCVGEIRGVLRDNITICDLLEATFPPGSITGAPKIRAMQIINELEPTPRGPYCGSIGILGKSAMLNVAIRTALFKGGSSPCQFKGVLEYSTGCGIVAESDPVAELQESIVKTHILHHFTNS